MAESLVERFGLDPNTKLNHVGTYTFEGDVSKVMTMGNVVA